MSKYYRLTKISITGFEIVTRDIEFLHKILDSYVCSSCKMTKDEAEVYCENHNIKGHERDYFLDETFPNNYDELPLSDKADLLLSTSCGLEFILEEFYDYDEYMENVRKEVEEHFSH